MATLSFRWMGASFLAKETSALREALKSLLAEGQKNIVLDLANVSLIDSAGLGVLVSAYSSAKARGASLRLCNLGSRLNELLQITKLYTVFEVSDTVEDAVRATGKQVSALNRR
jgi:anti-sigma B factor antagonist